MQTPDYIYGNEAGRLEKVWTEDAVDQLTAQIDALTAERAECEALRFDKAVLLSAIDGYNRHIQEAAEADLKRIDNERSKA